MKHRPLTRMLVVAAAALSLVGCSTKSPAARFYTLTPMAGGEAGQPVPGAGRRPRVNVAPVEIPDYLDRPQIVTRAGESGVKLAEYDRWAGSLADNISSVLAEDLAVQLRSDRVFVNPGAPYEQADYSITTRILRLDLIPGDRLLMKAQWTLFTGENKSGAVHLTNLTRKLAGNGYEAMVSAINETIAQLSRDMAREIAQGEGGPRPQ